MFYVLFNNYIMCIKITKKEATFESSPQIVISTVFIMKSTGSSPIIVVSLCFSLWSLISRVVSDDKKQFKEEWQSLEFEKGECCRCKCVCDPDDAEIPIINVRFLYRLLWRLLEITNRIFVATMIWLSIGGFGLTIIICAELVYCLCLCFASKTYVKPLLYFSLTLVNIDIYTDQMQWVI